MSGVRKEIMEGGKGGREGEEAGCKGNGEAGTKGYYLDPRALTHQTAP